MLERNRFAMREHEKILSSVQSYPIRDGDTGEIVGSARENIGALVRGLRWVMGKHLLPATVEVSEKPDDSLVFTLHRGWYIFKARVEVRDSQGELVGYFHSTFFTMSGGFHIYDKHDKYFAQVTGSMFGSNYRFLAEDGKAELGRVAKKLDGVGGLAREVCFSADNYFLEVNPDLAEQPMAKMLLLAATLAVELIYKRGTKRGLGEQQP